MSVTQYAYCFLSSAPMRAESSDRSEMVNMILFGEAFEIIERKPKWIRIRLQHDQYEGWIDPQQCRPLSLESFEKLSKAPKFFVKSAQEELIDLDGSSYSVTRGACLPGLVQDKFDIGENTFTFKGELYSSRKERAAIKDSAMDYMGTPYYWGGRSTLGIDCSGFTQMIFRMNGIFLPRDASQQAKKGRSLSFLEECNVGDLAFFDNAEGDIVHVGMILEDYKVIHASGRVRIDTLDHSGIYNQEMGKHTHKLRVLKSILD
ncbi:C40 family peptidase [Schleiferiaceae bacterium]|jgi:hypothetical protein|nr:C40 family peptidase [Schleiferiaceae bacterium]